ncbi:MBL fold metallo-hydrolase [Geminocystis sp. NIES-3709]|uniref:MBL fold metallo-hydrolase n=1 Tax=Geminocystis sp. NIES-3709 TaxID=1617448 RepID=UPI0005FCA55E|nr:MBL fold metallo-hydrolase [Geminocystis sp. NIES-3709]BAQ64727.1 hypothetical protein GM3709_1492 [Geminocystis sp. NIES-3709]
MNLNINFTEKKPPETNQRSNIYKSPKLILDNIFAFSPNRDTLGGTSYLLIHPKGNILIDCPSWHEVNRDFCLENGGVKYLFFTHRDGISKYVRSIQNDLHCDLLIQEQEGYLLPNLNPITFSQNYLIYDDCELIWTSGYSPGSSCLYYGGYGGVLFSGRHLLPTKEGITALKLKKTFHWRRQLRSVNLLLDRFSENTLNYICPGANTGYLRGKGFIDRAYSSLKISVELH